MAIIFIQTLLERGQRGGLAAPGWFPYLAHIGYMKVDEVAKVWRRETDDLFGASP